MEILFKTVTGAFSGNIISVDIFQVVRGKEKQLGTGSAFCESMQIVEASLTEKQWAKLENGGVPIKCQRGNEIFTLGEGENDVGCDFTAVTNLTYF